MDAGDAVGRGLQGGGVVRHPLDQFKLPGDVVAVPVNFREPYLSRDPREFWQRWHVTLSYWLRDYVYIRMGGREAYVRNILIVFALVAVVLGMIPFLVVPALRR